MKYTEFDPITAGINRRKRLERIAKKLGRVDEFQTSWDSLAERMYLNSIESDNRQSDWELQEKITGRLF